MSGNRMAEQLDDCVLKFGKYRGKTPNQIADQDPSYVVWMHANILPPPCTRDLALACEMDVREKDSEYEDDLGWRP
jgi:hypothetical protein